MLRPATPLTVLFFVAFVLLLLSTLSAPIVRAIPLATYTSNSGQTFNFGVFGWCNPTICSSITVGYDTDNIPGISPDASFNLPSSARNSLSGILVVHPVATLMTLICTAFAGAAHFHSPAHSPRYLLFLLIFSFPTLLLALLAFLVDILLFVPHMAWGGWLVLVATLIITGCSVLTCAMRRTLVSRKARKKRIAENAEMNGANYYASRQEPQYAKDDHLVVHQPAPEPEPEAYARAESPPPLPPSAAGNYASFDDRTPLNAREPSIKTNSTGGARDYQRSMDIARNGNGLAPAANYPGDHSASPVSPLDENGPPDVRRDNYFGPPNGMRGGRGGPPSGAAYGRGRGGYPPRGGYGRGGPMSPGARGPPPPGWGNAGRGGYPPRGMPYRGGGPNGMRGPPPPGWQGPVSGGVVGGAAMMGRGGRRGPPPGYANQQYERDDGYGQGSSMAGYSEPFAGYGQQSATSGYGGAASQGYGEPEGIAPGPSAYEMHGQTAEGIVRDPASLGFSGRQASASPARSMAQPRGPSPPPPIPSDMAHGPVGQAIEMDAMRSPEHSPVHGGYAHPQGAVEIGSNSPVPAQGVLHARTGDPVELSAGHPSPAPLHQPGPARQSSDDYYEDVDPRYAQAEPMGHAGAEAHPPNLMPGYGPQRQPAKPYGQHMTLDHAPSQSSVYAEPADMDVRTKSPAQSDNSNFTSISQRGVNPDWQPEGAGQAPYMGPPGNGGYRGGPHFNGRGPPPRQVQDTVLNNNPDFSLGPAAPGGRRGPPGGRAYHHAQSSMGSSGGGRYPGADGM